MLFAGLVSDCLWSCQVKSLSQRFSRVVEGLGLLMENLKKSGEKSADDLQEVQRPLFQDVDAAADSEAVAGLPGGNLADDCWSTEGPGRKGDSRIETAAPPNVDDRQEIPKAARTDFDGAYLCELSDLELDSLRVGICVLDRDCRIVWLSRAMEEYFGLKRQELIGRDKRELLSTGWFEPSRELRDKLCECYRNNTYVEHFECYFPADGERGERWLEHWSQPIQSGPYAGGRIEHYYDITEHKITERVLHSSGSFLRTIISSVNEGIVVFDKELRYQLWNEFMEALTGMPARQVLGRSAIDFLPHEERDKVLAMLRRALQGETVRSGDMLYWAPTTGKKGWVRAIYSPRIEGSGAILGVVATYFDISERKQTMQRLQESEDKYRSIYNAARDAIVIVDSATGEIIDANDSACQLYGFSHREMIQMRAFDLSAEPEKTHQAIRAELTEVALRYHRRKDGAVFPVEISAGFHDQGGRRLITAIIRDVSERRRAEKALQRSENNLRQLATKLLTVQEHEQKRMSRELHDELGQSLLALKLQVRAIEQRIGKRQQKLRDKCEEMLHYIDELLRNVERLSRDLSPLILENLGLFSALRWLFEEVNKRTGIESCLHLADLDDLFSPAAQILIYRVIQECLTNTAKHAHASRISLRVHRHEGFVTFEIEDDGRGFDAAKVAAAASMERGLGLAAMEERVRMLGGVLSIDSGEQGGTKISFEVPTSGR